MILCLCLQFSFSTKVNQCWKVNWPAWEKREIWAPNGIQPVTLKHWAALYPLMSYEKSWRARSLKWVVKVIKLSLITLLSTSLCSSARVPARCLEGREFDTCQGSSQSFLSPTLMSCWLVYFTICIHLSEGTKKPNLYSMLGFPLAFASSCNISDCIWIKMVEWRVCLVLLEKKID